MPDQQEKPSVFKKEYIQQLINHKIEFVKCMPDDEGIILYTNMTNAVPFYIVMDNKLQITIIFMISKAQYSELIEISVMQDSMMQYPDKPDLEFEIFAMNPNDPEFKKNRFAVQDFLAANKQYNLIMEWQCKKDLFIGFEFLHDKYEYGSKFLDILEDFAKQLNFHYEASEIELLKNSESDGIKKFLDLDYINSFIVHEAAILNGELQEETRVIAVQQEL